MSELVKELRRGFGQGEVVTLGGVSHDQRCLEAADEIERLHGVLEAVTNFHQVTHCHAAARAGMAGLPVGERPDSKV